MRLTAFTDYGLRILMHMATAPDRPVSTADLAKEFALSRHHLTKIIQRLASGGIVATRRGGGGGATLARAPSTIALGSVVRLLEQGQAMVDCFAQGGGTCTVNGRCGLKSRLRKAEQTFLADLDRSTLADIALPASARPAAANRASGKTAGPRFASPNGSKTRQVRETTDQFALIQTGSGG